MTRNKWSCASCDESRLSMRVGRARFCVDCKQARTLYNTTRANLRSGFNRGNKGSPKLQITIDEFCRWRKAQSQVCHYCGIRQEDISVVGMKSQIQRPVKVMGVDRLDSEDEYRLENMKPCCFVCNQVKGNRFSPSEMKRIGLAIGKVWRDRIATNDHRPV